MTAYLLTVLSIGVIYGLLSIGLSVQWGLAGLVNFGQVAFFAIGAYTSAILSMSGVPLFISIPAGGLLSAGFGAIIAASCLRLRQDYLALVTLGFGEVVRMVAVNEQWLTGGASGIPGIPRLLDSRSDLLPLLLIVAVVVVCLWVISLLTKSPFGRVLAVIREDEVVATFLGRNVFMFKAQIFAIGAFLGGIAGAFFAHYITLATPEQFVPSITVYAWIAVMLGGQRNPPGAVIGAMCLMAVLEATRFAKDVIPWLESTQLAALRLGLVGLLLIVLVKTFPNGINYGGKSKNA